MVTALNRKSEYRAFFTGKHWVEYGNADSVLGIPVTARRLVVLDPESAEDVRRLIAACETASGEKAQAVASTYFHAALRELANPTPPKPEEPTGLGAVVEDATGIRWVRSCDRWLHQIHGYGWTWDQVSAVRVLSEGVVPE